MDMKTEAGRQTAKLIFGRTWKGSNRQSPKYAQECKHRSASNDTHECFEATKTQLRREKRYRI